MNAAPALVCTGLVLATSSGPDGTAGGVAAGALTGPIDATYRPGTVTALPATAATTRLLWTLAGVLPAASGRVTVGEREVRRPADAVTAGVHLVPEGNALLPTLTARENVLLPGLLHATPGAAERAAAALEAVGLAEVGDHLVEELSGGQQQRVAVARALAQDPPVLLAHEPTSALDAANRHLVLSLLASHAEAGRVVVLTTDDPEALALTGSTAAGPGP